MSNFLCRLTMLAMVLMFGLTSFAEAANRAGAFTLSPMLGTHLFSPSDDFRNSQFVGLKLGYNFTKSWGMELAGATGTIEKNPAGSGEFDYHTFQADLLYHFQPDEKLVPYFVFGVGGASQEKTVPATSANDDAILNFGVGAKYFVTDWLALRLDARHEMTFSSPADQVNYNNFIFAGGLSFQFGGNGPNLAELVDAEATPLSATRDSDNDGVIDSLDLCIETPAGAGVDSRGCETVVEEISQPVVVAIEITDTDQGGVFNIADNNPNSETGKPVEASGYGYSTPAVAELNLEICFESNSSIIASDYTEQLQKAADFMNSHPDKRFIVDGYTDSSGPADLNQMLSQKRAETVRWYLVRDFGADRFRVAAQGFGDKKPLADNATPEGRKLNRRVLVRVAN